MKGFFVLLFFVLFFQVLQTAVAPAFLNSVAHTIGWNFLCGHTFDLVLICVIYFSFRRDTPTAVLWGYFLSVVSSWFGQAWPGATLLSFLTLSLIGSQLRNAILVKGVGGAILLAFVVSLFEAVIHLKGGEWFASVPRAFQGQIAFIFTQAFLNAMAAAVVHPVLRFVDGWGRNEEGYGGRHVFLPELR